MKVQAEKLFLKKNNVKSRFTLHQNVALVKCFILGFGLYPKTLMKLPLIHSQHCVKAQTELRLIDKSGIITILLVVLIIVYFLISLKI